MTDEETYTVELDGRVYARGVSRKNLDHLARVLVVVCEASALLDELDLVRQSYPRSTYVDGAAERLRRALAAVEPRRSYVGPVRRR